MGLDNYWMFDIEDVVGIEQGEEITIHRPAPDSDETLEETYFVKSDQENVPAWVVDQANSPESPEFGDDLGLTGGLLSGSGPHSFRGKVYSLFIEKISGESLYTDRMDNETVQMVSDKLNDYDWESEGVQQCFNSEEEFSDFCEMWEKYANAGAWLHGWW